MVARGKKRHRIDLENPGAPVPDNDGGFTETWTAANPPSMYAEIKPATARDLERVVAATVQSTASHVITMDYHPEVTTKTRLTFGSRVFEVQGVHNPDERNIELIIACTEVVT